MFDRITTHRLHMTRFCLKGLQCFQEKVLNFARYLSNISFGFAMTLGWVEITMDNLISTGSTVKVTDN